MSCEARPDTTIAPYPPCAGVWVRAELWEPKGSLVDTTSTVYWVQSTSGIFIDLRIPRDDRGRAPQRLKAFAGKGELDTRRNPQAFTWTRHMDYRVPGTPDVGTAEFLDADTLQEDGVLPGDDYREIWRRVDHPASSDCTVELVHAREPGRRGYFLRVGETWAVALDRSATSERPERAWFEDDAVVSSSQLTSLRDFVACVGSTDPDSGTWRVIHSTREEFEGATVCAKDDTSGPLSMAGGHPGEQALQAALREFRVDRVLQGSAPSFVSIW